MSRHQRTLLLLGGSLSSQTTPYGIWQDGGPGSPVDTLAGGSAASGAKQAFLMNYHFEGITAVPGGFNLVAISSAQEASMTFVPASVRHGYLGPARWYPVNVAASSLCPSGCSVVTGNTSTASTSWGSTSPRATTGLHTYLAAVAGR